MDVLARSTENVQVELTAGRHRWVSDEPLGLGHDSGPNPYDLLLGALAACKVKTCKMYAGRKGWSLEAVEVSLNTSKVHARDCEVCESDPNARVDVIQCRIGFRGDLTEEQVQRLVDISERCPVHRTLTSETRIKTTLQLVQDDPRMK